MPRKTRHDPRPRIASRRWSRPHAHPPEVCVHSEIDDRSNRAAASFRIVASFDHGRAAVHARPYARGRTIEQP